MHCVRSMSVMFALTILSLVLSSQSAGQQHGDHPQGQTFRQTANLTVQNDQQAEILTVRLGPLPLPANGLPVPVADSYLRIPFDGWLLSYKPRLVNEKGELLPGRLLHHVAFFTTTRKDPYCPPWLEHIFASGGEMNTWPLIQDRSEERRVG